MNRITAISLFLSTIAGINGFALAPGQTSSMRVATTLSAMTDDATSDSVVSAREARIMAPLSAMFTAAGLTLSTAVEPALAIPSSPDFDTSIRTFFPGAMQNSGIILRVAKKLSSRNYRPYNTILGSSLCSDEIDSTTLSLQDGFKQAMAVKKDGGVFNLGGLGGVPFVGKSGFGAFLSHVPESGKVLIMYGPHVGISNDGVVGKVERVGQSKPSTSCGAGIGAYKALMKGPRGPNDKFDYQEEFIIDTLEPRLKELITQQTNSVNPALGNVLKNQAVASVTVNMFDIINEVMEEQVYAATSKPGFFDKVSEVTLLGGIVINRGHGNGLVGGEDFFQPLQLTAITANGEIDMFNQVFGDLSPK
jgi:hypothetical protein